MELLRKDICKASRKKPELHKRDLGGNSKTVDLTFPIEEGSLGLIPKKSPHLKG